MNGDQRNDRQLIPGENRCLSRQVSDLVSRGLTDLARMNDERMSAAKGLTTHAIGIDLGMHHSCIPHGRRLRQSLTVVRRRRTGIH